MAQPCNNSSHVIFFREEGEGGKLVLNIIEISLE